MNVEQLPWSLELATSACPRIETEQCTLAVASLRELRARMAYRDIYFWGKICGDPLNYYVAFGYKSDVVNSRYHWYSTDCLDWKRLPLTTRADRELALMADGPFTGQPQGLSRVRAMDGVSDMAGDMAGEMAGEGGGGDQVPEEMRVATVVALVNHEAAAAPRGALVRRNDGIVVPTDTFTGLRWEEATSLRSYLHFRPPLRTIAANLQDRPDHILERDFLDPLTVDLVLAHSVKVDRCERVVLVRSLVWPGYFTFHRPDTPDWGFLYVGLGHRDKLDMPMMLPALAAPPAMHHGRHRLPKPPPPPPASPAVASPSDRRRKSKRPSGVPASPIGAAAASAIARAARSSRASPATFTKPPRAPTTAPSVDPDYAPDRSPSLVPMPYPRYDASTNSSVDE